MTQKVEFRVYSDWIEEKTKSDQIWTSEDVINAYFQKSDHDPHLMGIFETRKEAEIFVEDQLELLQSGWIRQGNLYPLMTAEILILQEVELGGRYGEEVINEDLVALGNDQD